MRKTTDDEELDSIITPDRLHRALEQDSDSIELSLDGAGNVRHARSFDWPLDFYFRKRLIIGSMHRAGMDFHHLWRTGVVRSGFSQNRYDVRQENKVPGEKVLGTEIEYNEARTAIRNHKAREVAHQVCCLGVKAGRGNMDLLREALSDLYTHFKATNE